MNAFVLGVVLVCAPWHFGFKLGWSAGLYGIPEETVNYRNPSGSVVDASRPAIPPPGFFRFGLSVEDERSIGFATDLNIHYKNYTTTAYIDSVPYFTDRYGPINATQDIPYMHVQWAWGIQKTIEAGQGCIHIPLGFQFTNNWFVPAVTEQMVEDYIVDLASDIPALLELVENPELAIDYVKEHRMGMRLNFAFNGVLVRSGSFRWLLGTALDWNILFGATSGSLDGLSTAFML